MPPKPTMRNDQIPVTDAYGNTTFESDPRYRDLIRIRYGPLKGWPSVTTGKWQLKNNGGELPIKGGPGHANWVDTQDSQDTTHEQSPDPVQPHPSPGIGDVSVSATTQASPPGLAATTTTSPANQVSTMPPLDDPHLDHEQSAEHPMVHENKIIRPRVIGDEKKFERTRPIPERELKEKERQALKEDDIDEFNRIGEVEHRAWHEYVKKRGHEVVENKKAFVEAHKDPTPQEVIAKAEPLIVNSPAVASHLIKVSSLDNQHDATKALAKRYTTESVLANFQRYKKHKP